ncbi:hypothetical protein EWH70_25405 [Amycolatopsis suaedae]|uniref:Uncharacterized protein n=1 Tax=Amycolatopsis suaedae TaxID=2510978 RepID=A0A4Q7J4J4_9PSEU|nr:hypothetical protein EWH70_25405 [Amycolatopsis suaedae]
MPGGSRRLTPEQRSSLARLAAYTSWANTVDRAERTRRAREAAATRFERQVDPRNELDPTTRRQRAESARRAHFQRMAYLSSLARRRKRQSSKRNTASGR